MGKDTAVGYLYCNKMRDESDHLLMRQIEKRVNVMPIMLEKQYDITSIENKIRGCKLIINYSAAEPFTFEAIELSKTFEEMGKKVINSSHSFFYQEDKWMFYLKCLENSFPTPRTCLIPKEGHNEKLIRIYLDQSPLVLKAIFSDKGLCVEKVNNYSDFKEKLRKISLKNPISPIIAQEFILNKNHQSVRVTLVGYKVVQSVVKYGKSWKQTGDEDKERFRKIKLDNSVIKLCEKASKAFGMEICGLDLIKSNGRWYIIEANSCPGLSFIKSDQVRIMNLIADYVK